ncbi:MAG: hypothetical protein DYG89_32235 [Caldilinea sp. CFX5]|nr:hypothetical protein [Caldilinea sp. CFX5]
MKLWHKVLLITLVFAAPALVLGPIIWPPDTHMGAPVGFQLVLFILLAAMTALTFGLGVAFLWYGLPLVRRLTGDARGRTWATFLATTWLLVSWWPHDNMHKHNGMDLGGLLVIEYGFHVTMMIAGLIVAYNLVRTLQSLPEPVALRDLRVAPATNNQ